MDFLGWHTCIELDPLRVFQFVMDSLYFSVHLLCSARLMQKSKQINNVNPHIFASHKY